MWIKLPESTRHLTRRLLSIRCGGNGRTAANSSSKRSPRPPFRIATTFWRNSTYDSRLAKSRLPRTNNACSTAVLKCPWADSLSPFSFGDRTLVRSPVTP